MTCPSCSGPKLRTHYLCRECWDQLPHAVQRALYRRDAKASLRLLELHRQLNDDVALPNIQITP